MFELKKDIRAEDLKEKVMFFKRLFEKDNVGVHLTKETKDLILSLCLYAGDKDLYEDLKNLMDRYIKIRGE